MRLFIAIRFPPQVDTLLRAAIGQLERQTDRARLTRPENLHLTLAFLGESDRLSDIRTVMDAAAVGAKPFHAVVTGSGRFGDLYWAGLEPCSPLTQLAEQLRSRLRSEGFAVERKPFKPHITLARQVCAVRPVRLDIPRTPMRVDQISLMRSDRINGRLTYTEIYKRPLG